MLNWLTFRLCGASRFHDATCVPGRSAMAIFRPGAFPGGNPWQFSRFMHPKSALGREKGPSLATYRRRASKTSWLWQDMLSMHSKCPANRLSGMRRAKILPGMGPFRCTDPSNHARRANLAIPGCFVWALRARGCRRSACGSCAAPLCAGQRGVFAGSPHAASSCPRPRARCSCCRACPRVRRARCPPPSEARTFRGALCEVSAFASRRWVCPSPSTRRLCLARPFRGGARLLNWLALRMRAAPTAPSPRP